MRNDVIPIDFNLIKETKTRILELADIVKNEKYKEDDVLEIIREVNNNLKTINTVPYNYYKNYYEDYQKWGSDMKEKEKPFKKYADEFKKLPLDIKPYDKDVEEKIKSLEEFNKKYNDKYIENIFGDYFNFDFRTAVLLLSKELFIKYSRQRRIIRLFTEYIFKIPRFIIKIATIVFLFLITTFIVQFLNDALSHYDNLLTGIIVTVIAYFILNKPIDKLLDKFFWRMARRQTLVLCKQLEIYTSQIKDITEFMKLNFQPK
ncbi:MAG: hypothetical protein LBH30_00195 [Prevotellaceae bacterium]|jgi:hypothetical protein|nr:hypothetical protein [Prevotellaceae bacterium]